MSSLGHSFILDRRMLLRVLGLATTAALLPACSTGAPESLAGPDMSGSDPGVRPQDDLYSAVNGSWMRRADLATDDGLRDIDPTLELNSRVPQQLRELIEGITDPKPGTPEQQVRDLYDAYCDTATRDVLGITPLHQLLGRIDAAKNKAELATVVGQLPTTPLFDISVEYESFEGPVVVSLGATPTGMPGQADQMTAYRVFLERLALAAGFADPSGAAARVVDLEQRMAAIRTAPMRRRDSATRQRLRWSALTALGPEFDWDTWALGRTDRPREVFATVLVQDPSYVTAMSTLWRDVDIDTWRDFLRMDLMQVFADCLTAEIAAASLDYSAAATGVRRQPEQWREAIDRVARNLDTPLGELYAAKYLPVPAEAQALRVVKDLLKAAGKRLRAAQWISPATRTMALARLGNMTIHAGGRATDDDYSGLTITRGRLVESLLAAFAFRTEQGFDKVGRPVKGSGPERSVPPQVVMIQFDNDHNDIYVTAGHLQPPFFDPHAESAVNYGGIGVVIGRELFTFLELRPHSLWESMAFNSMITSYTSLGDLFGLSLAVDAYALACKRSGDLPDYRALFESWARTWRPPVQTEDIEQLSETVVAMPSVPLAFGSDADSGPYIPPPATRGSRCNEVVRNLSQFYTAFDVTADDKLFRPAEQRVVL